MNLKELKARIQLAWAIVTASDSNYIKHAQREFTAIGSFKHPKDIEAHFANCTIDLLRVLGTQHHSGGFIHAALATFEKLALFQPLGPLTGDQSEWVDVADMSGYSLFQNNRCSHVFRDDSIGRTYDLDGFVLVEPNGVRFHSTRRCAIDITFPYIPAPSIEVHVPEDATDEEIDAALAVAKAQYGKTTLADPAPAYPGYYEREGK